MEQLQSIDFYYGQHLDVKEEALRDIQRMVSEGNFFFDGDYDSRGNEVCFAHQPDGYCKTQANIESFYEDIDAAVAALKEEIDGIIAGSIKGTLRYRSASAGCARTHEFEATCVEFKPSHNCGKEVPYLKVFSMVDKRENRYRSTKQIVPVIDWHY